MAVLPGKVAVVTGGGSGIGRATCLSFANEGASVVVASNVPAQAGEVADEIGAAGGRALAVDVDVTDADAVARLTAQVVEHFGRTDILVTSAGVKGARSFITDMDDSTWRTTIEVNLTATFTCIKAFLPGMLARDSGRIITISSMSGKMPSPRNADYIASKHGVIGLTKALAVELGVLEKNGITANAICPGPVPSPMLDALAADLLANSGVDREQFDDLVTSKTVQRRFLDADEIASMAVYLASHAARSITGQAISVDGGAVL